MESRKATLRLPPFPQPSGSARLGTGTPGRPTKLPLAAGCRGRRVRSSAPILGSRRARFGEGPVDPERTSATRGGLGEYTDARAMFTCGSALCSCSASSAGIARLVPLYGTPGQATLSQAPPPPPALERGHRLLPGGSVRRGRVRSRPRRHGTVPLLFPEWRWGPLRSGPI